MEQLDHAALCAYAKSFAGVTPAHERTMRSLAPVLLPELDAVTGRFYSRLAALPSTAPFLEGRLEQLKRTHRAWLESMFTQDYDAAFTGRLYRTGDAHVTARLPIEFMAGGMTMIQDELIALLLTRSDDKAQLAAWLPAINAALGYALIVIQESYQSSKLAAALESFLDVTGMSRSLFQNVAAAHRR